MPETRFLVRWPDASRTWAYSPSSTVRDFFRVGTPYPLDEFLDRSRRAMSLASARVERRYGYACSAAAAELERIERAAAAFPPRSDLLVTVEAFDPPEPP